jgi:ribosomal protein S18 acetylase RimI-like enzyme
VKEKIFRKYLEIKSLENLKEIKKPSQNYFVDLIYPEDFQLNKFFYKNIGKNYQWVDKLDWSNQNWIDYVSNKKFSTYILKDKNDPIGFFELIKHKETSNAEIAFFGILEKHFGKKLGGYLLSEAIKESFHLGFSRVWVHTCSLDHKNALKNYLARGMKVFKSETLIR